MLRYYKPVRGKEYNRGYFSYITESVINLLTFNNKHQDIIYYHDLKEIPGYGNDNIFEICFIQDSNDYLLNIDKYVNIDDNIVESLGFHIYDLTNLTYEQRVESEKIIKKYFKLNDESIFLFNKRLESIDYTKTIGVHRRATDIITHHPIIPLEKIFDEIDLCEFDNIFLMCDNKFDYFKFKERYKDKLICYDTYTSDDVDKPFFKSDNVDKNIKNHITELVFGVTVLSNVKLLICSKSNLSTFSILSNSKLKYKILE